jgi:tRNA pseudouridine55 synthase
VRPGPANDWLNGILLVDKPAGPTSHDVVDRVRRRFRLRKVGHGGTLDPQATGLLILLIGKATRLSARFLSSDKTYEGTVLFGVTTDSHDREGQVLTEADASGLTRESTEQAMARFRGDLFQAPPMVSAVKKDGVPLYKLARKGQEVEREPRLIHLYEFRLTSFEPPRAAFVVRCTKGTYVRTLCHDLGQALGCGACLDCLRRTQCGEHRVEEALPLDRLLELELEELDRRLIPLQDSVRHGPVAP